MNHSERGHALLSASASHRWLNCTPSARLEALLDDNETEAAREGTLAHEVCEGKLRQSLGRPTTHPCPKPYDQAMSDYADEYVAFVLEQLEEAKNYCPDPSVLIEQKLDYSRYVPEGFGTGDCIIVGDNTLHVIDFKYGQGVLVECEDNPQMKLYALGALEIFDKLYEITEVAMTIYQPRRQNISTSIITKAELYDWAENDLKPRAELAYSGKGDFKCGEHCQFCKAKVKCRARAEANLALAKCEFKQPPLLEDYEIEEILPQLDNLASWANCLKDYATARAIDGHKWGGFKIVEGRSVRRYGDENAVAETLTKNGINEIWNTKIKPITDLEKTVGKAKFNELVGNLIIKPRGKLTLVPEGDKRAEYTRTSAQDDFKDDFADSPDTS